MLRRIIAMALVAMMTVFTLTSCNEAERVKMNLAQEADNFNCVRRITVIDCITGDTLFQMTGRSSITADNRSER